MRRQQFFKHQLLLNRWANLDKLGRNVTWEVLFKNCSQNLIPSKTLVAMATKWNFLANSLKIFSSETASWILKLFHRDVPWVTLFKNCSWSFDPSKIVALVNGGFLHYTEMKEFFKNLLLWNRWSDCEKILHRYVPWVTLFKNCLWNFDPSKNVALVNGGYLHYTEMKEFLKNLLLWNRWSDFEIISQSCSLEDPF